MTKEEVKDKLLNLGFIYEFDEDYHRHKYTSMYKNTRVEIIVDYYSLMLIWWYKSNRKVSRCFNLKYLTEPLDNDFVENVIKDLANCFAIK